MTRGCVTLTAGAIILVVVAVPWVLPILLPLVIGFIWCAADCVPKALSCEPFLPLTLSQPCNITHPRGACKAMAQVVEA